MTIHYLPTLLPSEPLVQKGENFRYVKLDVLKVQLFLSVFLHFQKIVKLQIELQEAAITPWNAC